MTTGRCAPSPSGDLHLGNLRTYALAWLCARSSDGQFLYRIEDIDTGRSHREFALNQMEDLASFGVQWDGKPVFQSDHFSLYESALQWLSDRGLVYECYCSRKEIQEASRAPHSTPGSYPGTCRNLTETEREHKRQYLQSQHRVPSLRLRADVSTWTVTELFAQERASSYRADVDDFVLRRGDDNWAYNFAVVVDDLLMGIDQITRGDDLLSSAPRQNYLAHLLYPWAQENHVPVSPDKWSYIHVPLVLSPSGSRLAKRDGAVTLRDLGLEAAFRWVAESLGFPDATSLAEILPQFDLEKLPRTPVTFTP